MEPSRSSPLQIPAEDEVPLFDPSGLSASLSVDDWPSSFDRSGIAATRLGIGSSTSHQSSPDQDLLKRGRRRRSSPVQQAAPPTASVSKEAPSTRMWWERDSAASSRAVSQSIVSDSPSSLVSPRSSVFPTSIRTSFPHNPIPPSSSVQPDSPTVRSPAADFLNSLSSANSVISPPLGSYDNRSFSYSPPRPDSHRASTSIVAASEPWLGMGSAAAHLYDSSLPRSEIRLDQEGARVGPSSKYLLGKTIGFGGFSIVREGWDQHEQSPDQSTDSSGRKIAVKIVYHESQHADAKPSQSLQELDIWSSLPAHAHILPLLHHEQLTLDHSTSDPQRSSKADLLIMPFCDRGNLLDFVRSEGGPKEFTLLQSNERQRPSSGTWMVPGSSHDPAQLSRSSSMKNNFAKNEASLPASTSRSGSGFVFPRMHTTRHLGRVASTSGPHAPHLRTIHAGLSSDADVTLPTSATDSSIGSAPLSRRVTSKTARSQGVPIDAARETMRQLTSALLTLHNKSHILHGDLKLENVLGQGQTSWKKRQRRATHSEHEDGSDSLADSMISTTSSVSVKMTGSGFVETDAVMPCWRIADFGLAQKVETNEARSGAFASPALTRALKEGTGRPSSSPHRKAQKSGRGGSLGYTAPEYLRAQGTPGTSSPAVATDDAATDATEPSPYAADMWALGCILYALLSGRLPFADSFEPRLQMKIAKAEWELPPRLRRRAERLAANTNAAAATATSAATTKINGHAQRNSSGSLSGLPDPAPVDRFAFMSQRRSVSVAPMTHSGFGTMDLSASLPSLLPTERHTTEPLQYQEAKRAPAVHSEHVVGSAPGTAHHLQDFEINQEAKALAEMEADPESDDDADLDPAWDGLSADRAGARQVLRGLLDPDPVTRWTVGRLATADWILQDDQPPPALASEKHEETSFASMTPFSALDQRRSPAPFHLAPSMQSKGADDDASAAKTATHDSDRGRRSSSLARTKPANMATPSSPSLSLTAQDEGESSPRRSRSATRVPLGKNRSSSRTRSKDASGTSTPNREREYGWLPSHTGTSQAQWTLTGSNNRSDSPADSERRGRKPRLRMADLDENKTWTGDEDASSSSRSRSRPAVSHRAMPIPIRSSSQSRSRSRHSGESGSPRPTTRRSMSHSRSTHSLPYDADIAPALLHAEVPTPTSAVFADRAQAIRTAPGQSRAPDALAHILGQERSRSRPPSGATSEIQPRIRDDDDRDERLYEQETRGRARDRKG